MTRLKSAMSRTAFILLTACLMHSNFGWSAEASGDMADFSPTTTLSPEYINRFMTNNKIDGVGNQEKCAKQVLEFRQRFTNETRTLGVEPTVGLGAALLIFLMVGAFAAGIAQAFQLVITIFQLGILILQMFSIGSKVYFLYLICLLLGPTPCLSRCR